VRPDLIFVAVWGGYALLLVLLAAWAIG